MLAEAAPLAPVAIEGGVLLAITGALILASLVWAMLFGLQQFYTYTFGAILHGIAKALDLIPFVDLGEKTVGKIDNFVQAQIGNALTNAEQNVARCWHALAYVARLTAYTVEVLAHSTLDAIHAITRSEIPSAVGSAVLPRFGRLERIVAALSAAVGTLGLRLYGRVGALEHDLGREFGRAWQGIDNLRSDTRRQTKELAGSVAAELGALNRYAHGNLSKRVGKLETFVGGAALTGLIAATVARIAPWIRCKGVGKAGQRICRTNADLLDSLLSGLLLIAGTVSLLELARGMQSVTDEIAEAVRAFIREAKRVDAGSSSPPQLFGVAGGGAELELDIGAAAGALTFGLEELERPAA